MKYWRDAKVPRSFQETEPTSRQRDHTAGCGWSWTFELLGENVKTVGGVLNGQSKYLLEAGGEISRGEH